MSHTKEDLKELQSKSLEEKIQISTARIIEWYEHWDGNVFVSFSGGKDSTVLLDLVRRIYPDTKGVFVNTGLEYPEVVDFVKSINNIVILKPEKSFVQVLKSVGYPIGSKRTALNIEYGRKAINRGDIDAYNSYINGVRIGKKDGTRYNFMPVCKKLMPIVNAPVNISNKCCDIMKKKPLNNYCKQTRAKPINGTMTEESRQRLEGWVKTGCNVFTSGHEISHPLSFWTEQDILNYIYKYNLSYASAYGELKESNSVFYFTKCQRTGCVFCGFGCHLEKEPNRFQALAHTHPQLYDYCMRGGKYDESTGMWIPDKGLGMAKVLDYINVKWWNDGDEAKRDEYRAKYKEKEEYEQSRKKSSQAN